MKRALLRCYGLTALLTSTVAISGCSREAPPRDAVEPIEATEPSKPSTQAKPEHDMKADASIGVATMQPDGTIVLDLRAEGPDIRGDARIVYPKDHPRYQSVLDHLGGLEPGESKPVPPWPDE